MQEGPDGGMPKSPRGSPCLHGKREQRRRMRRSLPAREEGVETFHLREKCVCA